MPCDDEEAKAVVALAADFGFEHALLFPAPSPQGRARLGLLVLGSSHADFVDRFEQPSWRAAGRDLAMALLEGWSSKLREDWLNATKLSDSDLRLLDLELTGAGTKAIARRLGMHLRPSIQDSNGSIGDWAFGTARRRRPVRSRWDS